MKSITQFYYSYQKDIMALTPDDIYVLFIIKRTQVEMIADRGFLIPPDEIAMFIEDPNVEQPTGQLLANFVLRYTPEGRAFSREEMSTTYANEDKQLLYVYFAPPTVKDKQGVSVVNGFIETLYEIKADFGIIVTSEGFTTDASRSLDVLTQPIIQIFYDKQLHANPIKHNLTPIHTRLTPDERNVFLRKSKLKPTQILVMSIDDPIVRYFGWKTGDIIRIMRTNLATNKTMIKSSITYRIVTRIRFDAAKKTAAAKVTA